MYTQTPPCRLAVTESYAWTIPAEAVAVSEVSGNPMQLKVVSNKNTEAGQFTVTLVNTITYAAQSFTDNPTVTFMIDVIDPCTITTFQDVTVNPITMILGATTTQDFIEALVQTEVDNGGLDLCGTKDYLIVDASDNAISWMPITGSGPYTITASPTDESLVGSTLDYYLKITFTNQAAYPNPVKRMSLPVTITAATCNCDLLTWDNPTIVTSSVEVALGPITVNMPSATQNENSKTLTPEIRKCFANSGSCPFTSTYAVTHVATGSLPDFIVQTGTTNELTITPTTSAHMSVSGWTLQVTQTVSYTNFGTTDTITFDGVTITVGCTITGVPNPSPPTEGLTYTLYEPTLAIDLTSIPFTQSPPCDYPATNSYAWTNPEPTIIFANPFNALQLSVWTIDPTKLGSHTMTLVNTVSYDGGSWSPTYSFDITIVDPCASTQLVTQTIETLTTDNGVVGIREFLEVKDTVEVAKGQSDLCGPRAYEIKYQNDDPITWVTVAAKAGAKDTYEITADPTLDEHATLHTLKLIVTLTEYTDSTSILEINFNVNVVTPACECNRVGWDAPAKQTLTTTVKKNPPDTLTISHGTVNADSLLTTP